MSEIPTSALTEAKVDGTGLFDILMQATKAHLEQEFTKGRIKGPEYAQVYLGSLTQILQTSASFLLEQRKSDLEEQMLQAQIAETNARVLLVEAQTELAKQEKLNAENQWLLLAEQKAKMTAETALLGEQVLNAQADRDILTWQKQKIEAEVQILGEQVITAAVERELMEAQRDKARNDIDISAQQKINLAILRRFQAEGIAFAYPTREVIIRKEPD